MDLSLHNMSKKDVYCWMTQLIAPRPIAWVLSMNSNKTYNLAPFSYFNAVSSQPPVISMSIGKKKDGEPKDTFDNIFNRTYFTIHIPEKKDLEVMVNSSAGYEKNVSEPEKLGLKIDHKRILIDDEEVDFPVLQNQSVALFGRYFKHLTIGDQYFLLGEVLHATVSDNILNEKGVDWKNFKPLARLGKFDYSFVDSTFSQRVNKASS